MTPEDRGGLVADPLTIDVAPEEILADLSWPGPPPGLWLVPPAPLGPADHVDTLLERIEDVA